MIDFSEDYIWLELDNEKYENIEVKGITIDRSRFTKTSII